MQKTVIFFMFFLGIQNIQAQNLKKSWYELRDTNLSFFVFMNAYRGLAIYQPPCDTILTIIDFSLPSTDKRLWIIDLKHNTILKNTYVAHGMNSGENYALHFSNQPNTQMSAPGFYLTQNTYYGKHGYSLRLKGLEKGINDNAMKRAIVLHGAWYVSEDFIKKYGRLGRSFGCPAVPEAESEDIINLIKNGSLIFIYAKTKQ
jgi:hypothetical protein